MYVVPVGKGRDRLYFRFATIEAAERFRVRMGIS